MNLKSLVAMLLCSATIPAFSADIEFDDGQPVTIDGTATNGTTLYVGRYNADNSLTLTNGGSVVADAGFIGKNSDNNTLLVTGTNSSLQLAESLEIGKSGKHNALMLEDGGWASIGTTNGTAGAISVGDTNGTASLAIGNGSNATADFLYVGTSSNESGIVTLSGSDTELIVSDTAYIGQVGSNNTVSISSGATLAVTNLLQIGSATSSNNVLNINSGGEALIVGSVDVQNPGANQVNINNGGQLTYTGNANLDHADENGFNFKSGSTLEIGGALQFNKMDSGVSVILNGNLNTNLVSSWNTGADEMYVGENANNNKLTIKDGATATAGGSTAHIGEYSRNNAVNVTGTGSVFTVSGQLIAGMQGDNNSLSVAEGGSATINNDLRVGLQSAASGNSVAVSGTNSILTVGGNAIIGEAGTQSSLTVTDATMDIGQTFTIGKSGADNSALVTGSNAVVNVGGDLLVGLAGDDNELKIESGAQVVLSSGNMLVGTNGASNSIRVTGTNSLLDINGYLTLGNLVKTNSNTGNTLSAFETGRVAIGGDLSAYNGSVIQIEAGSQIAVGGDYWQDETSELFISMSTNSIGMTNLAVTGEAHFATNTTITVIDDGTATNEFEQIAVSSSDLYIGTNSATTTLLNDTNSINFVNHLLDINGIVTNNNIVLQTVRLSIAEKSGLEGTSLEPLANEIDGMALAGNTNAIAMRNVLGTELDTDEQRNQAMNDSYGEKESSAPMHNVINQGIGGIADQLTVRGDNTRARRTGPESAPVPVGAEGPHMQGQELQGWIAGYGSWADHSASDGFNGYDADLSGFIIGADLAVAPNILVGVAGGSNSGSVDKSNGGSGDTKTTYGAIYASVGTQNWFFDGSMLYGTSSIEQKLGNTFDTTADYDAQNIAFYLGGGKEITGQYFIITPQASLLANYYKQDAYDEKSTTAVGRAVDSFDALYVRSSIGCNFGFYMAMGNITLKPEIRAHWLHEFNASEEDLSYTLIGGTGDYYNMILQAPEQDVIRLGAGIAAKLSEYLELRADLDTRQASGYSDYTLLGSLRYQF